MMKKTILLLLVCLSNGWLFANHWTPDGSMYEDNMTLTGVIQINGVEQQSTTLEVGVFCGGECRGTGMPTYFFPTQHYVVQLLIFGEAVDQLTFKLYDHALGQELNLTSPEAIAFTANGYGSLGNPYVLNFIENEGNHWIPNGSMYEDNMTLTGVIQINGVEQQSTTLEVGVFCGGECRGTGMPTYFFPTQRYVVQLLIFGEAGDQLTFKLYDHALGQELNLTSPNAVTFTTNGYGTLRNPYVLNFTGEPSTITQTIPLSQGWNWFSTYIEVDDPVAMLQTIEAALGENGVQIESFDDLTEFDGEEWYGGLDELGIQNEQTYLVLTNAPCTVQLQGVPANPAEHPITIYPGWNWIGFPCTQPLSVVAAFANFVAEDGDLLERSDAFMEFDDGEWYGEIETLLPGEGYMYFSNSTQTKILVFPVTAK